jgi:tetratricopeptide (TPR) repeat protein
MISEKAAQKEKLWRYLDLIQKDIPNREAAVQAFGDLKQLEQRLNRYIRQLAFYYLEVETPSVADPKGYASRIVPPLEMLTLRGDFYVHTKRWAEAKAMLDAALQVDPENPAAHTSMGLFYRRQDLQEEAEKHFLAAVNYGAQSCLAHYFSGMAARN